MSDSQSAYQVYGRLLRYTKQYRPVFFVGILGYFVYANTQWFWAELLKFMADAFLAYVSRHVVHDLRLAMFQRLLHLGPAYYQQNAAGRLLSKMTYNTEQVAFASSEALKTILQEGFTVFGLMAYLLYLNWKLSLIFFAIAPIIGWSVNFTSARLNRLSTQIQSSVGDVTHATSETINGYESVKIYSAESWEGERFAKSSSNNLRQSLKLVVTQSINTPVVQMIMGIMLSMVIWLALNPAIFEPLTVGDFMAFITATGLLAKPLRQLTQVNAPLQSGIAAARSVFEVLDLEEESDRGELELLAQQGHVVFENVTYRYPEANEAVLKGINLTVEPGQTVAIVGASGAGKTTLIKLLPRFITPDSGRILIDGQAIEAVTLASLRHKISIVNQHIYLFNDSIRHNIAYGELQEASDAEIWAAAEAAQAKTFIERLPDGLDTRVGPEGTQLSGGQQQRIALARAVLKNAPILILDEATSALDQSAEQYVQAALDVLRKNRTTFVVAHRLSTIQSADLIVVLQDGEIVEQGDHHTLMNAQGAYAAFVASGMRKVSEKNTA
ncbi:MAG: lipid A export permease/ATP-binding protein MsbA [Gammaproteobacteria bacterium]